MERGAGGDETRTPWHVDRSLAWASATLILLPIFAELQFSTSLQAVCKCLNPPLPFPLSVVVVVVAVVGRFFLLMMPEALVKLSRLKLLAASNCRHQRSFAPPPVDLSPSRQQVVHPPSPSPLFCTRYKLELDVNSATIVPAAPPPPPTSPAPASVIREKPN